MKYVFFLVALTILFGMTGYVFLRIVQALPPKSTIRMITAGIFIFSLILLISGLLFENTFTPLVSKSITFIGYTFLIVVFYLFISFLIVDIIRLSNFFFHFAPAGMHTFRFWALTGSLVVIAFTLVVGNYKFNHPKVVQLNLTTDTPKQNKEIKIIAASDIHLGCSIDKKMLKQYVKLINAQHPDIVFLLGDITDRSVDGLIGPAIQTELMAIKAPLGIYAIFGNHEYYSGRLQDISKFLRASGITVLQDSVCLVDNSFYVVGRDDRTNTKRKPLAELVNGLNPKLPKILLDHQPYNLQDAERNGLDLQLSGHTHNGQIFPENLIVKGIFELAYGYLKKGKTQYYVSSGLGLWGPQYRIGTQSELVEIKLKY
jgi:predicted MPP superfamily phosphohydrolase